MKRGTLTDRNSSEAPAKGRLFTKNRTETKGVAVKRIDSKDYSVTHFLRKIFLTIFFARRVLLIGFILAASTPALGIEALPGSTWGIATHANGVSGDGFQGYINQGIDWTTLPGGLRLNTYAEYRYRAQTDNKQYFNAYGPVLGLEFKKWFLRLGTDYYWVTYPEWPGGTQRSDNHEYYLIGYYDWDINKAINTTKITGFPGSTWFDLNYDGKGLTGSGLQGYVNQGVAWFTIPGDIIFDTYVEYRYRAQTKQFQYYNAQGPVVGLEFRKSYFRLGADYYWQEYPRWPGEVKRSDYLEIYLTWYIDWDLKKLAK